MPSAISLHPKNVIIPEAAGEENAEERKGKQDEDGSKISVPVRKSKKMHSKGVDFNFNLDCMDDTNQP